MRPSVISKHHRLWYALWVASVGSQGQMGGVPVSAEPQLTYTPGVLLFPLAGVETLLEDTIAADPEWPKLLAVPGLLEPWNDAKDKWQVATDEFKVCAHRA